MLQATRPTFRAPLSDDPDEATKETLQYMFELVDDGKVDDMIRQTAIEVARRARAKDTVGEIAAIFEFVRTWVRYTRDTLGIETIATPRQVLLQQAGDCDDATVATSALLAAIGIPSRLVALDFGDGFSHVITEAHVDELDDWIALDPTENRRFGWSPPGAIRRMMIYVR